MTVNIGEPFVLVEFFLEWRHKKKKRTIRHNCKKKKSLARTGYYVHVKKKKKEKFYVFYIVVRVCRADRDAMTAVPGVCVEGEGRRDSTETPITIGSRKCDRRESTPPNLA